MLEASDAYFAMYACVGLSAGSHPMLIADGSSVKSNHRNGTDEHHNVSRALAEEALTVNPNPIYEHTREYSSNGEHVLSSLVQDERFVKLTVQAKAVRDRPSWKRSKILGNDQSSLTSQQGQNILYCTKVFRDAEVQNQIPRAPRQSP